MKLELPETHVGEKFGRLTLLRKVRKSVKSRTWVWLCQCDCGNEREILWSSIRSGHTQSCGCFRIDNNRNSKTTHGNARRKKHSKEYRIWRGIISRCTLSTNPAYADYGGRGITVCQEWKSSFELFLSDMGKCPEGRSIDRINNDAGYSKENCRWATPKEQSANKRKWTRKADRLLLATGRAEL